MKSDYLSLRINPMLKETLQKRADDKQHTLSETVTEMLIETLLDEGRLIKFSKIIQELICDEI